ncbi:voltage-dependent calcium channel gamma-3 subunit [Lates japonicus]|uniref:Voltage-dependent calcium channel gamma-3 subunit n=1 Tax=Lates japonicus TaxID=270547 RepID=A0AAD3NEI5_LATJO|nr:voltage-dependent calcium channel gamma-3 subunit [Lates japonicus]
MPWTFRGVCKKIDHFPEDADYEADAAEYLLRAVRALQYLPHHECGSVVPGALVCTLKSFIESTLTSSSKGIFFCLAANLGDPARATARSPTTPSPRTELHQEARLQSDPSYRYRARACSSVIPRPPAAEDARVSFLGKGGHTGPARPRCLHTPEPTLRQATPAPKLGWYGRAAQPQRGVSPRAALLPKDYAVRPQPQRTTPV